MVAKRYNPEKVEALLRWVETGMVDEADGAGYELAQAVREAWAKERRVEGWAVVNMRTGAPLTFYYSEEVARDACRPLFSEAHKVVPCEVILHDAPGEEAKP